MPDHGSNQSLSSNEAVPEMEEFDDDISDYKEQQMDELLQLPHDDSKDHPSEDEDSLTDCGLQFRVLHSENEESSNQSEDDYAFIRAILDSELPCQETDIDCTVDVLRVAVAYSDELPPDTSVRLHINPDASAREIVDSVICQVNEAVMGGQQKSEAYISDQNMGDICLVVSFDSTERYLSDSFQPLKVQNPWTKGRLLVKRRTNVCESGLGQ
ncbi:hypothetical protein X975_01951, partial [Stegodyphus mimosarum]